MFTPLSKMSPTLQAHLRYPPDIFSIQSAIFGRYHLTNPQAFYAASNAWQLSPTAGAGPQSQALLAENTYNSQGQLVSTTPARMAPQYQVYALPGTTPADLHHLQRVRTRVAIVVGFGLQSELQHDGVDGRAVRPGHLRPTRRLRDAAGHNRPGQRRRRDLGQPDGLIGHLAARPEGVRGAPRGDADGPDRRTPWCTCARCTWRRRRTRSRTCSTSSRYWGRT